MKKSILALSIAGLYASSANAATPSVEEMWEIIQQQQAEIQRLKGQLTQTDQRLEMTEVKVEATADAVESAPGGKVAKLADWVEKTSIGGYGELHYNNLDNESGGADKDEIDVHRFVLFFGHQFNENVRFFSEFEVEHSLAGEGKNGEVEIEQAFIEWDFAANHRAKAGLFLVPVGILNETHEPDTFYGVERNKVESEIIPSTWWEAGVAVNGEIAPGLSYDVALHSGLFMEDTARIRSGRQKVSEAKADNFATSARIKYTGVAGLELAATLQYQSDVFQGETFSGVSDVGATLFEAHAIYQNGPFGLRALYASWDFDSDINAVTSRDDADERDGFFIEPSFKITESLGIFARYSEYDEVRAATTDGMDFERVDIGINYWLSETVVLKADYQDEDAPDGRSEMDGFNLGVGWSF